MIKLIIIFTLFFFSSCCGYESFNVRHEVKGDTLAADIIYNTKGDGTSTEVEVYDAPLPWDIHMLPIFTIILMMTSMKNMQLRQKQLKLPVILAAY